MIMTTDLYTFAEAQGEQAGDLFFTFHGTGGNENQFMRLARDLLPKAHVISPRGDVSEGGALRFFRRKAEGIYDLEDLANRTAQMAAFVSAHKQRLKPKRLIGLGYSNGANILASLMFADGSLFDMAVLMHPLIPFAPQSQSALAGKQVLITAGERDPICPPEMTRSLENYLSVQGSTVKTLWHAGGHEIRQVEIETAQQFLK
jgi:phospholipase/carboxylesterase